MKDEFATLSRRDIVRLSALAGGISVAAPGWAQFGGIGKVLDAGKDVVKAETISDAELKTYFDEVAAETDRQNPIAGPKDPYGKRLATLAKGLNSHDGLTLDIKAYLVKDVNAFAMGNGTIRVFAGLMDQFTDDEIRYVIGHEIGHVKAGHSKKRMQTALRASALQKGAGATGGTVGRLASSQLGDLFNKVVVAQHSQKNENEADDYAMNFMKTKGYEPVAAATALEKLAAMEGDKKNPLQFLSTHPSPGARAKRMRAQLV
ncbi:MAG: M48 family metallopeptidase [Sphingorhabdus sp.]|nr:M48 family metallopeptidase [Sphingorhabdus sp.]